jgi:hypothetical protein
MSLTSRAILTKITHQCSSCSHFPCFPISKSVPEPWVADCHSTPIICPHCIGDSISSARQKESSLNLWITDEVAEFLAITRIRKSDDIFFYQTIVLGHSRSFYWSSFRWELSESHLSLQGSRGKWLLCLANHAMAFSTPEYHDEIPFDGESRTLIAKYPTWSNFASNRFMASPCRTEKAILTPFFATSTRTFIEHRVHIPDRFEEPFGNKLSVMWSWGPSFVTVSLQRETGIGTSRSDRQEVKFTEQIGTKFLRLTLLLTDADLHLMRSNLVGFGTRWIREPNKLISSKMRGSNGFIFGSQKLNPLSLWASDLKSHFPAIVAVRQIWFHRLIDWLEVRIQILSWTLTKWTEESMWMEYSHRWIEEKVISCLMWTGMRKLLPLDGGNVSPMHKIVAWSRMERESIPEWDLFFIRIRFSVDSLTVWCSFACSIAFRQVLLRESIALHCMWKQTGC